MIILTRWPQMASSPATLEPRAPQPTTATTTIVFYFFIFLLFFLFLSFLSLFIKPQSYHHPFPLFFFSLQSDQCYLHHSLTLFCSSSCVTSLFGEVGGRTDALIPAGPTTGLLGFPPYLARLSLRCVKSKIHLLQCIVCLSNSHP